MRKFLIPAITVAATFASILTAVAAHATTGSDVLTYGSAGGTNVTVGSTLSGSLSSGHDATWATTSGGSVKATCTTSSMTEEVTANPAAPGTADTTVETQTFSGCSDTSGISIVGSTITSLPYPTTINDSLSDPVGISSLQAVVEIEVDNGQVHRVPQACGLECIQYCSYTGTDISGTTNFTNQLFSLDTGGGADCDSDLYFSANYGSLTDTSVSGHPVVYIN